MSALEATTIAANEQKKSKIVCITSSPPDSRWGQPPASFYVIHVRGEVMHGELACDDDSIYVDIGSDEYIVEMNSALRPDQSWFWTAEWQTMEQEVDQDLATGRYEDFDTIDDFISDLERMIEQNG